MAHGQRRPAHRHPSPLRSRRPIPGQCGGSTAGRPRLQLTRSPGRADGSCDQMVPTERHARERRCWQRQPDRRNQSLKDHQYWDLPKMRSRPVLARSPGGRAGTASV
jgi:hypothetical protein